jgi:hypothetical protein
MLAKVGIQEFSIWIPVGVYPDQNRGRNDEQKAIAQKIAFLNSSQPPFTKGRSNLPL